MQIVNSLSVVEEVILTGFLFSSNPSRLEYVPGMELFVWCF